jgi:class 3 adenylate cyclase
VIFQATSYGRTANLASRLASVAQAREVVISAEVAHRAEAFSLDDMGPVSLNLDP